MSPTVDHRWLHAAPTPGPKVRRPQISRPSAPTPCSSAKRHDAVRRNRRRPQHAASSRTHNCDWVGRRATTTRRGRTPGLPPAGRPPRRGRCGCRARMALSDRAAPARVHRRDEPDAVPLVVDHAVGPSRLRSSTASRTARSARRASPCSRCRCRSRPAIGVRFTGARASRCSDARPGARPRSGVTHPQVAAVESVRRLMSADSNLASSASRVMSSRCEAVVRVCRRGSDRGGQLRRSGSGSDQITGASGHDAGGPVP